MPEVKELLLQFAVAGLQAGVCTLAAMALCALLRKLHAPGRLLSALWLVVGLRFLVPGGLVKIPLPRPHNAHLATVADTVRQLSTPAATPVPTPPTAPAANIIVAAQPWWQGLTVWHLLAAVWVVGAVVLLVRAVLGYRKLNRRVALAYKAEDGCFTCNAVPSPFTLGILHPRVYLPTALQGTARQNVVRHERCHIRRGDTVTKPLYYLVACLHWWNPLAWLAFHEFSRCIELACDEAATRGQNKGQCAAYCETMLHFATAPQQPGALAFGSGKLKGRIAHVLHYRKPGRAALAVLLCAVLLAATACMASPSFEEPGGSEPVTSPVATNEDAAPPSATPEPSPTAWANDAGTWDNTQSTAAPQADGTDSSITKSLDEAEDRLDAYLREQVPDYTSSNQGAGASTPDEDQAALQAAVDKIQDQMKTIAEQLTALDGEIQNSTDDAKKAELQAQQETLLDAQTAMKAQLVSAQQTLNAAKNAKAAASRGPGAEEGSMPFLSPLTSLDYVARYTGAAHKGDDLAVDKGTSVMAVAAGVVKTAEYHTSYGNYIIIYHGADSNGNTWKTLYAHLDTIAVTAGQTVEAGDIIGTVGSTGNSTGNHLHLELWRNNELTFPSEYILYPEAGEPGKNVARPEYALNYS